MIIVRMEKAKRILRSVLMCLALSAVSFAPGHNSRLDLVAPTTIPTQASQPRTIVDPSVRIPRVVDDPTYSRLDAESLAWSFVSRQAVQAAIPIYQRCALICRTAGHSPLRRYGRNLYKSPYVSRPYGRAPPSLTAG